MIKAQLVDAMAQNIVRTFKEMFPDVRKITGPDEYGLKIMIEKLILKWLAEGKKQ